MSGLWLLIFYIVVFLLLCFLLATAVKRNHLRRWTILFLLELLAAMGSVGAVFLFDSLPGTGMMPGLTWLAEVLFSMGAAALYALLLAASFFLFLWKYFKSK